MLERPPPRRRFSGEGNLCLRCWERKMYTIMRALLHYSYFAFTITARETWPTPPLFSSQRDRNHYLHLLLLTPPVSFLSGFMYSVHVYENVYWLLPNPLEAEFLDEIQTKSLQSFPPCYSQSPLQLALRFIFLQTHATSYSFHSPVTVHC
jgi:hypothetical protein